MPVGCGSEHGCENTFFGYFPPQGNFDGADSQQLNVLAEEPAYFSGHYAFLFQGKASLGGAPADVAVVGSLQTEGPAAVKGVEDVNNGLGAVQGVPFTGTYTFMNGGGGVVDNNAINLTLDSALGTQHFTLFLPYTSSSNNGLPAAATKLTFVQTDGGGLAGHGEMKLQIPSAFAGTATQGAYLLDLSGATACTSCSIYGHDAGAVFLDGQLFIDYPPATTGGVSGTESIGSGVSAVEHVDATFTPPDANGRIAFSFSTSSALPGDEPTDFVAYAVDAAHYYVMSLDPHSKYLLLSGTATQQ